MASQEPFKQLSVKSLRPSQEEVEKAAAAAAAPPAEEWMNQSGSRVSGVKRQLAAPQAELPPPVFNHVEVEPEASFTKRVIMPLVVFVGLPAVLIGALYHFLASQPGGPLWNEDPAWHTQLHVMRLCVAEKLAEPVSMAGLDDRNPFGTMTTKDRWGNFIEKRRGLFLSAGEDGTLDTGDDISANFLNFTLSGPVLADAESLTAMTKNFPESYRNAPWSVATVKSEY